MLKQRSEWQASIERQDNSLDYSEDNCCVIALEVNTAAQWNRAEFDYAFNHAETVDHEVLGTASIPRFEPKETNIRKPVTQVVDDVKHYNCSACGLWLVRTHYNPEHVGEGLELDNYHIKWSSCI